MPQYHLPKSGTVVVNGAETAFFSLDTFTRAFIEAMFWTESGKDDIAEDAGYADLAPSALETIVADCARFQAVNAMLLEKRSVNSKHTTTYTNKMPHCAMVKLSRLGTPDHSINDLITIAISVKPSDSPNEFTSRLADQMHQKPKIKAINI